MIFAAAIICAFVFYVITGRAESPELYRMPRNQAADAEAAKS